MRPTPTIGWTERIELPDLSPASILAKIDTGARTSALHAFDLEILKEGGASIASFEVRPRRDSPKDAVRVQCPVLEFRPVRSSNGQEEVRPVIETRARLGDIEWPIEVTLAGRDEMGFRMLLGRAAVRDRFLVDPGRTHLMSPRTATRRDVKR